MFALLVPGHDAVVTLPRAVRVPLHLASCRARLTELATLLNWLAGQGITGLDQVDAGHCGRYLHHRSHIYTATGAIAGDLGPATRRMAVQAVLDLIDYRDLFTTGRPRPACGHGETGPPAPWPDCEAPPTATAPRRFPRRSSSRCSPPHCM